MNGDRISTLISCCMIDGALEANIHGIDQPNPTPVLTFPSSSFYCNSIPTKKILVPDIYTIHTPTSPLHLKSTPSSTHSVPRPSDSHPPSSTHPSAPRHSSSQ